MDSLAEGKGFELSVPLPKLSLLLAEEKEPKVNYDCLKDAVPFYGGSAVRIPFPPAESLLRT
jgi:hypothetical protein